MVSKRVYIDHLRMVGMFRNFSRKDLEKIAALSDVVDLPAGRVIVEEGREGREAFVVLKGVVVIRRNGRKVAILEEGAILGELSLLDNGVRSATAVCETDCQVLMLTRSAFIGAVDEVPALSHKLMASLATRIRDLDTRSYG